MKKNIYMMLPLLLITGFLPVSAQGIKFEKGSSWDEIKTKAKKENKLIFVDFYTDWCVPCKRMASNIFPLAEVGDFYNPHFVAVQLDAEKEGKELARQYKVHAYPTMAFIKPDGELVSQIIGSVSAKELNMRAQNALKPNADFTILKNKLDKNELSNKDDLYQLMVLSKERGDDQEAIKAYEKYFSLYAAVDQETYGQIKDHVNSSKDPSFTYLMKNRKAFSDLIGKDKIDAFIKHICVFELETSKYASEAQYQEAKKQLQTKVALSEKEMLEMDSNHYWNMKDENHFMKASKALFDKYIHDDDQAIGNLLGGVSRKIITTPEHLLLAKTWAERAYAINGNAINSMQLAMVYKELKDKKNALKYANIGLEIAKKDKVSYLDKVEVIKKEIEASFDSPASFGGIQFQQGNWEEIKAMAKAQNKLIFIDFGAVWCAPCRYLTQHIFPQKEAGDFYNKNFICIQVDIEKGEGGMLARKFKVGGLPDLIFTNAQEKVIYRTTGSSTVAELIKNGEIALTPQDDYAELKAKYLTNELSKDDLYRYLLIVKTKGNIRELNEVLDKYVVLYPEVNLEMLNTIADNVNAPGTKAFNFLEQHRDEFAKLAGKDAVEGLIRKMYTKGVGYKDYKSEEAYKAAIDELNRKIHLTEEEQLKIAMDHAHKITDKNGYMAAASILAAKYNHNNDEALSLLIGGTMGFKLTKDELLTVKSWAERALSLSNNSVNALSLAMTYKNLKNKKLALKYIDIAIQNSLRDQDHEEGHLATFKKQIEEELK